jgi:hypothetical protein
VFNARDLVCGCVNRARRIGGDRRREDCVRVSAIAPVGAAVTVLTGLVCVASPREN